MSDSIVAKAVENDRLSTVLLVDDEEMLRDFLSTSLIHAGLTVAVAADAAEALSWIDQARSLPKLLVTDIDMPGMSGVELARRTRSFGQCPVLLISGKGLPDDAVAEGWEFLAKPFSPAVFVNIVQRMLNAGSLSAEFEARPGAGPECRHEKLLRKAQ